MHVYLAPWPYVATGAARGYHRPVGGTVGCMDLRTLAQMGAPNVEGPGAFGYATEQSIPGGVYLGEKLDAPVAAAERKKVSDFLGRSVAQGTTTRALLWESLTAHADPLGLIGARPLQNPRFKFGGEVMGEDAFHLDRALAVFRADYELMRALGEDRELLAKWAGAMSLKILGRLSADVLDPRLRSDGVRQPETSFSETFPSVSATISSGQDQPWTEVLGDMDVLNAGGFHLLASRTTGDYAGARCETALSSADHWMDGFVVYTVADQNHLSAVGTRYEAGADSHYFVSYWAPSGLNNVTFGKVVTGTPTFLEDIAAATPSNGTPYELKLQSEGSEHTSWLDTVVKNNAFTDTSLTAGVRIGARQYTNNDSETFVRDITAADIVAELTAPTDLSATPDGSAIDLAWTNTRPDLPTRIYRRVLGTDTTHWPN